jgi:two-component system, OmpR family, sensor histidine kinase MprB
MSLRSRLALLFALVAFVASVFVGALAYRGTKAEIRNSTDDFLRARAAEVASGFRDGPRGRPGRDTGRLLNAADDDSIIQISGEKGRSVSTGAALPLVDASDIARGRGQLTDIEIDDESFRMFSQVLREGTVVQVARSTAENDRVLARLVTRFVLIALIGAALAAALGWSIASRTTSPLRRLAAVANDVAKTRNVATANDLNDIQRSDEIGSLATSFRSMLDALESSRVQQHRLIHDAGHEIRTPLTSMRANIELLERATELPTDQRTEVVRAIKSELLELTDLFDEMIDLATDQGDSANAFVPIDFDALIRTVAERWQWRSSRVINVDSQPATVAGDATMLERALSNLISNGDKFSPPDTPLEIVGRNGAVHVRDHGPGVPEADQALIFERFYRSEATRSMPGSGLGLSIVAQIVERHRGDVWVADAPDGGAIVGFRLQPIDAAADPTV